MTVVDKIKRRINELAVEDNKTSDYSFNRWYLETALGRTEQETKEDIVDGTGDRGIDSIVIDHPTKTVSLVQSKYSDKYNSTRIGEGDLSQFTDLAKSLSNSVDFDLLIKDRYRRMNARAKARLKEAFLKLRNDKFSLDLIFISTHKDLDVSVIKKHSNKVKEQMNTDLTIMGFNEIKELYNDYERDNTPRIGKVIMKFSTDLSSLNFRNPIKACILPVRLAEILPSFSRHKENLFNKNVRDFLGSGGATNKRVRKTVSDPDDSKNFMLYNNGVTIICDEFKKDDSEGEISMRNPQIINGCQTIRSILDADNVEPNGHVIIRVFEIKNDPVLTQKIIFYQNLSNPLQPRDFYSGDPLQVKLKQDFRNKRIYYNVKRGRELSKLNPIQKNRYNFEIKNDFAAKLLYAVLRNPAAALTTSTSKVFDTEDRDLYMELFENKSYKDIFSLFALYNLITNKKGKTKFTARMNSEIRRTSFYILNFIYNNLSDINKLESLRNTYNTKDFEKIVMKSKPIFRKLLDILYDYYSDSDEDVNFATTFLQRKLTHDAVSKNPRIIRLVTEFEKIL